MIGKRVPGKVRLCVLAATAAFAALALAATTPRPPTNLCIGANCAPTPSGGIKFHPGDYIFVGGPGYSSSVQSTTMSILNQTSKNTNVMGIQVAFKWVELEGAKAGDYSAGFALIDGLLAKLASMPTPKRLMILFWDSAYGTAGGGPPTNLLPQYIIDMPNGAVVAPQGSHWAGSLVAMARLDNPAVIDRLIALAQAYGNRYNSNPLVEMYSPESESSVSSNAGLNMPVFYTQMKRLYAAAAQAWPNTALRWNLNYTPGNNDRVMLDLFAAARALPQSVIGGPDPEIPLPLQPDYPADTRTIQANKVFRGLQSASTNLQAYEDLRGKIPWVGEYQGAPRIGVGSVLPADFGTYEINVMHAQYLVYLYNTWAPSNTQPNDPHKWMAQLAYIDSTHGATYPFTAPR
jgi:hypothetical protein